MKYLDTKRIRPVVIQHFVQEYDPEVTECQCFIQSKTLSDGNNLAVREHMLILLPQNLQP
jgi:hypothetical protein